MVCGQGCSLGCHVTVVDTVAESYLARSSSAAGAVSEFAATKKTDKYACLPPEFQFVPLAFTTLGSPNSDAISFLDRVGQLTTDISGEHRERQFLYQRLSVLIQKFNSIAFHGSFSSEQ